jgi:hypothetical protein
MSESVNESSRPKFSGVAHALAAASASSCDTRTVFSDFPVIGFPDVDDPPDIVTPRIYYDEDPIASSGDRTDRYDTGFTVRVAIIHLLDERAVEKELGKGERQTVFAPVFIVFHRIILDRRH